MKSLGMMNCTGIKVCTSSLSLEKGIQKYTCERRGVKFPTDGQRSQPKGLKIHPPTWVHMLKFGFQTIFPGKSTQWPSNLTSFKLPGLLQKTSYFCSFVFYHFLQWKKTKYPVDGGWLVLLQSGPHTWEQMWSVRLVVNQITSLRHWTFWSRTDVCCQKRKKWLLKYKRKNRYVTREHAPAWVTH